MNPDVIVLALASAPRPAGLAALYALLSESPPRRVVVAYLVAGLTFSVAVGVLVVAIFHGAGIDYRGTDVSLGDAELAAQDLLTPALLNHSSRAYTWGAAIAALHGITFDRELLYLAAMFHDTGIPSPVPDVDFTVRSAALAREFTDSHHVPADIRELVANAIAMHYTPGVGLESGAEAYLLSAGAAVDVFGLRSNEIPDAVRQSVIQSTLPRGLGFKREFAGLAPSRGQASPLVAAPGTCTASP